jgi:hypothetical protein
LKHLLHLPSPVSHLHGSRLRSHIAQATLSTNQELIWCYAMGPRVELGVRKRKVVELPACFVGQMQSSTKMANGAPVPMEML